MGTRVAAKSLHHAEQAPREIFHTKFPLVIYTSKTIRSLNYLRTVKKIMYLEVAPISHGKPVILRHKVMKTIKFASVTNCENNVSGTKFSFSESAP